MFTASNNISVKKKNKKKNSTLAIIQYIYNYQYYFSYDIYIENNSSLSQYFLCVTKITEGKQMVVLCWCYPQSENPRVCLKRARKACPYSPLYHWTARQAAPQSPHPEKWLAVRGKKCGMTGPVLNDISNRFTPVYYILLALKANSRFTLIWNILLINYSPYKFIFSFSLWLRFKWWKYGILNESCKWI